jgi:hypothetical protein
MPRALGISVHTGWGACVAVEGSRRRPAILANGIVEMLGDTERFCFHMAAEMPAAQRANWIEGLRHKAIANARQALGTFLDLEVQCCAIVARDGASPDLEAALRSHTSFHMAEGLFYRDVLRTACPVRVIIVPPRSLDVSSVGKLPTRPWGKDQKLAALAAWSAID